MNLTTELWIPIVWDNGQPDMVGLADAFARGHEIQDLAVRPHERIALMRLLICVAQAALNGPEDYDDWKMCQPRIAPTALDYLRRWQPAFELFGSGQRFLQVCDLKQLKADDEGNSISKLDLALATGNNTTLFDNAGGSERVFDAAQTALNLLSFQCFSPCGKIGVAQWNGCETTGRGSSDHAPCIAGSMLHAMLRGQTILETIHLNLLSKSQVTQLYGQNRWGKPYWEALPKNATDTDDICNATTTYLGRLVALSRAVLIEQAGRSMILANGLKFPSFPEWREPTSTVVVRTIKGKPDRTVLRSSLDRAPWRELHSLTVKTVSQNSNGGPMALQNVLANQEFDLWVGGLVADQAKLLDSVESVLHIPAAMLTEPSQKAYEQGVTFAKDTEFRLRRAVSVYHKELGDNLGRPEMREQRQRMQSKATFQFWTDAERHVNDLLIVAESPALLGPDGAWHKTEWGKALWRAVRTSFDLACPHGTARQIRAYTLGRQALSAPPADRQTKKETES